jgi:hypothetical protein
MAINGTLAPSGHLTPAAQLGYQAKYLGRIAKKILALKANEKFR